MMLLLHVSSMQGLTDEPYIRRIPSFQELSASLPALGHSSDSTAWKDSHPLPIEMRRLMLGIKRS